MPLTQYGLRSCDGPGQWSTLGSLAVSLCATPQYMRWVTASVLSRAPIAAGDESAAQFHRVCPVSGPARGFQLRSDSSPAEDYECRRVAVIGPRPGKVWELGSGAGRAVNSAIVFRDRIQTCQLREDSSGG